MKLIPILFQISGDIYDILSSFVDGSCLLFFLSNNQHVAFFLYVSAYFFDDIMIFFIFLPHQKVTVNVKDQFYPEL